MSLGDLGFPEFLSVPQIALGNRDLNEKSR